MAKLVYKTKSPKKGYVYNQASSTHKMEYLGDKTPPQDIQKRALELVNDNLYRLVKDLSELGYDPTKVSFSISYDPFNKCGYDEQNIVTE